MFYVVVLCIGASIGLSSGLFGIGGALIATPLLKLLLDLPGMIALGTPLPVAFPAAIAGVTAYFRAGLIRFRVVRWALLGAIPANIAGTWLTKYMTGGAMMLWTGGFMLAVGITFFVRGWLLSERNDAERLEPRSILATGAVSGFLAGFLAIGGGLVMVPAFVRLNKMKFKEASATSLFCVAALSVPATIGHWLLEHIDWSVALALMVAATPASFLGARLAVKLRNQTLERAYGTAMILFALFFLWRQIMAANALK
jgi:uncharacterized membrane protein YfcA